MNYSMAKPFENIFCQNMSTTLECSHFQKRISLLKTSKIGAKSEYHPIVLT